MVIINNNNFYFSGINQNGEQWTDYKPHASTYNTVRECMAMVVYLKQRGHKVKKEN